MVGPLGGLCPPPFQSVRPGTAPSGGFTRLCSLLNPALHPLTYAPHQPRPREQSASGPEHPPGWNVKKQGNKSEQEAWPEGGRECVPSTLSAGALER